MALVVITVNQPFLVPIAANLVHFKVKTMRVKTSCGLKRPCLKTCLFTGNLCICLVPPIMANRQEDSPARTVDQDGAPVTISEAYCLGGITGCGGVASGGKGEEEEEETGPHTMDGLD